MQPLELLRVYLAFTIPALIGFPWLRGVFPGLPDGGWGFARTAGLVAWAWAAWMGPSLEAAAYSTTWVLGVGAVLLALSLYTGIDGLRQKPVRSSEIRAALESELVFCACLILFVSLVPLNGVVHERSERFMDYAMLRRVSVTDVFPPIDPWMSGRSLSYYYHGYVMADVVRRVSWLVPFERFFNYALPAIFALLGSALFSGGRALSGRRSVALATVGIGLFGGTLQPWLELFGGKPPAGIDWFRSARVIDGAITEFPLFAFTWGDLHPYVFALPVGATLLGSGAQLLRTRPRDWSAQSLVWIALLWGALFPINSWDYPAYGGALAIAILASVAWTGATTREKFTAAGKTLAVALGSVILYLPFWLHFAAAQSGRGLGIVSHRSTAAELWILWGPFWLLLLLGFWAATPVEQRRRVGPIAGGALLLALVAGRWAGWITILTFLGWGSWLARHHLREDALRDAKDSWLPRAAVALCVAGLGLPLVVEFAYLDDHYSGKLERRNTVFKATMASWVFLSLGAPTWFAAAVARVTPARRRTAWAVAGLAGVATAGFLLFGVPSRFQQFQRGYAGIETMNALRYLRLRHPEDVLTASWMRKNLPPGASGIEATSHAYGWGARMSMQTGRPVFIGWVNHEAGWRNDWREPRRRRAVVDEIYRTGDLTRAWELARGAGASWLYVGSVEAEQFGGYRAPNLQKFEPWPVLFEHEEARLYRVPQAPR